MALQADNEQEGPDPVPSAPQRTPLIVRVWPFARMGIELAGVAGGAKHEGLYLAAQALAVSGDLAVTVIYRRHTP